MNSHDAKLTKILRWVEELGRHSFQPSDTLLLADEMDLDREDLIEAKTQLFTLLSTYTSGSVKASVRRFKVKNVFEAYRRIHFEGMRDTPKTAFEANPTFGR